MVKRWFFKSISVFFCATFLLSTLGVSVFGASVLAEKKHPETGDMLADEQVFTYRLPDETTSIDPQLVQDAGGLSIVRDLFEGLLNQDSAGKLTPGVALSWQTNPDKTKYTFKLREDAKWSNGDSVTVHDFVYAWRRAVDPSLASPYAWLMQLTGMRNVKDIIDGKKPPESLGARALDDFTLEVELDIGLAYFAQIMSHPITFPTHRTTIERHGSEWTKPANIVSNGAYILSEYVKNKRSTRVRNKLYWNNANTIIDKTIALIINDDQQALTRYLAGELDRTEIPAGQYRSLKKKYPNEAVSFPRPCNYYYTFNLSNSGIKAFKDVRVRQAMYLAIDRKVIVDEILAGGQFEAYTFTPEKTAGFKVPDIKAASMTQAQRDKKAKNLIKQAGYGKGGKKLVFDMLYNTSEVHRKIAIALSQMWQQKLGIQAVLANLEWEAFLNLRRGQQFELARGAWCGDYNEASTFLNALTSSSGYNDGRYSNIKVDNLLQASGASENPQEIYSEVERLIATDIPVIPIYHYSSVYMLSSFLQGWPASNIEQRWYSKDLYKLAR